MFLKKNLKNKIAPYLFIAPALLGILSIIIIPLFFSIRISFYDWDFRTAVERVFIGFDNYREVFTDSLFYNSLKVTIIYVIAAVIIEFFLGFILALILNSPTIKGMRAISSILISPMIIAPVAVGIAFRMVMNPTRGIVNTLLSYITRLPIEDMPVWFGDINIAFIAIIIVDVWMWTPFFMLLILSGLRSLPTEPFEAAKVDGASNMENNK
ncbi:Melibiose/raffinose/stachyose import permease protein MelD [subsurface metagenome]